MAPYWAGLIILATFDAFLAYRLWLRGRREPALRIRVENTGSGDDEDGDAPETDALVSTDLRREARMFKRQFFSAYTLAVAADWLQGPHIYASYKYDKQLPERTVALLYATGFLSAAAAAPVTGHLADRLGRRAACVAYCVAYVLACLSMLGVGAAARLGGDGVWVLLGGRVCGGIATTLLFSAFEAWMVSEFHARGLGAEPGRGGASLDGIFAAMTVVNSVVAIASGVLGDALIALAGSRDGPFLGAVACCLGAAALMLTGWAENYGGRRAMLDTAPDPSSDPPARKGWWLSRVVLDRNILALALASCFFEGTMYLFVFFWTGALAAAAAAARSGPSSGDLPFGLIFSGFMCAMMAGSSLLALSRPHSRQTASLVLVIAAVATSAALSGAVMAARAEAALFALLCVVEACVGAYYPSVALLKSELVGDDIRGGAYSVMRMPLNVFVVIAHAVDQEGDSHRNRVFLVCAGCLLLSALVIQRTFPA